MFWHRKVSGFRNCSAPKRAAFALLLLSIPSPSTYGGPFDAALDVIPREVLPGKLLKAKVTLSIATNHYLYATQTSIKPVHVPGLSFGKVNAPVGIEKRDPYLGAVLVYKTSAVFELPVLVAKDIKPGRKTLVIKLAYQGCTDTACFPPQKKDLKAAFVVIDTKAPAPEPAKAESVIAAEPAARPAFCEISASAAPAKVVAGKYLTIKIRFKIAEKHHLSASETSVSPVPTPGLEFGKVKSPKGVEKKCPYVGIQTVYEDEATFELPVSVGKSVELGPKSVSLTATYQGGSDVSRYPAESKSLRVAFEVVSPTDTQAKAVVVDSPGRTVPVASATEAGEPNIFQDTAARFGLLGMLAMAFVWGIGASLTPCVYPMIPITVTVIGANSAGNVFRAFLMSLVYVLGLSITYAAFGVVAAWSGGLFGAYAQHPAVRIVVAAVFGLLALSMFDVFYIQMPSAVSSKLAGSKGVGAVGVFFTGAASGAAVGPCVGPLLVALLVYIAGIGSPVLGFLTMWSFALGMGVLFLVVGTASGAATALPKAGPWMEKIKRVFGLFMLGFALYYVKPAVAQPVFLVLVGGVLIGVGVFAGAFDPVTAESTGRDRLWKVAGIVCLTLGVCYTARSVLSLRPTRTALGPTQPKLGIEWVKSEAEALAKAKQDGMPVMIDFRADWCSACLMLEGETLVDPRVIAEAKRFVCAKIDCTDTKDSSLGQVQNKYGVVGLPTLVFIDSQGRFLRDKSITEFVKPDALVARMRQVK